MKGNSVGFSKPMDLSFRDEKYLICTIKGKYCNFILWRR